MIAKALQEFTNQIHVKPLIKPIKTQMLEINGLQQFDQGLYHNQHYENLIKKLNKTRPQYREALRIEERKNIAQQEYIYWQEYLQVRKNSLTQDFVLSPKMVSNLKQIWDLIKSRNQQNIKPEKMLEFHMEYAKTYKFEVPLEAKCLQQLIHPHYGYITRFPQEITFDGLLQIYQNKLLSSYEKSVGQTLLGEEISAFTYWNHFNQNGYMNIDEFIEFMKVFKFTLGSDLNSIKKEFKFALKQFPGEFHRDIDSKQDIIRFDFVRYIFLERNL